MASLSWSACANVRDLGGLPVAGGGRVRERALVRADSLTRLDEDGIRALDEYGVGRIIDLRAEAETAEPKHPYAGSPSYVNEPWVDVSLTEGTSLADYYRGSLDHNTERLASIARGVASAPDGAVVVHCAAGKDRTGVTVALLLEAVGVPRDAVVTDYVESETALGIREALDALDPEERRRAEPFAGSTPQTITAALVHLDERYGGVPRYLREACGLSDDELKALRERLTEPA